MAENTPVWETCAKNSQGALSKHWVSKKSVVNYLWPDFTDLRLEWESAIKKQQSWKLHHGEMDERNIGFDCFMAVVDNHKHNNNYMTSLTLLMLHFRNILNLQFLITLLKFFFNWFKKLLKSRKCSCCFFCICTLCLVIFVLLPWILILISFKHFVIRLRMV